jgi:hypothetical protein
MIDSCNSDSSVSSVDGPTLSMRFADIKKRKQDEHISCYCQMNTDDDSDDDENNYTILRSGTHIPKTFAQ